MLNFTNYSHKIASIGANNGLPLADNYHNYTCYEHQWEFYFYNLFIQNFNINNPIRITIMESCPAGDFPNTNYIFSNLEENLNPINHRYLHQIFIAFFGNIPITKGEALISLANINVLIIDILPTHGFRLRADIRRNSINLNPINCCDFNKINNFIIPELEFIGEIKTVYSMPPSIDINVIDNHINNNINYGSMTANSGFPSYNLLINLIANGF